MIIKHNGATPRIDPSAWVAPNAVICGNVTIGPNCRVMFGALPYSVCASLLCDTDNHCPLGKVRLWRAC
jgi:hypothetical protein